MTLEARVRVPSLGGQAQIYERGTAVEKKNGEYIRVANSYLEIRTKLGPGRPSATGKNLVVATTGGFAQVEGSDIRVNLTAIRKV